MAKQKDVEEGKIWAFLGIFLTLIGFLLVLLAKKENKYALFYAKQGLLLFIASMVIMVAGWIPFLGPVIYWLGMIALVILWVIGLVYSLSGQEKDIPIIGEFARKINL